jgi:hypothetical protein
MIVKYPTRSRPEKFKENLERYIGASTSEIIFIINMDIDDASMNNQKMTEFLESKNSDRVKIRHFFGQSMGKINAINRNTPQESWDILVATADDMIPSASWDETIIRDFEGDFFKALNYNTDPRLKEQGKDFRTLITLPVIGRKLYDHFGYIYHPDYRSEFCDNEQTLVFEKMGVLKHIDKRPITHKWAENQDDLMRKNIQDGFSDRAVFEKRKAAGFPS